MTLLAALLLAVSAPALALGPDAREFMSIMQELEPVQCEKRKLRREIALAQVEKKDTSELRLSQSPDPEDLPAINRQRTEAFYRCD